MYRVVLIVHKRLIFRQLHVIAEEVKEHFFLIALHVICGFFGGIALWV